jgi:phage terminase large subunit GpA-like protein
MAASAVQRLFADVAKSLTPPPEMSYSEWATEHFKLWGSGGDGGSFRPWKFQRGILDAIGDPTIERVSVIKSARTGYTVSLVASIAAMAANDPGPIMLLMPTDDDARGIAVDEIDPAFRNNPHLRGLMVTGRFDGRNTLTQRSLAGGGSLKINSARSPNNLRRHTVRTLYCDEVDGMKPTAEGDPLVLAEKRTLSKADRKIVFGSTPTDEATSIIARKYDESDQRIFEVPCIHCSVVFELQWEHLSWRRGEAESVVCKCPHCKEPIEEKYKPQMVEAGEWRATRPHVKGHAGFRISGLMSQFANSSWVKIVEEFERAEKNGPTELQGFYNTTLGRVWSTSIDYVDENQLMARREKWGINWSHDDDKWRQDVPEDVAYITAGVDVQPDRLEAVLLGWSRNHRYVLAHHIIRGSATLQTTWDELDAFLSTVWKHPLGGEIGVEAACIDSGYLTQRVYDFCEVVQGRKIVAIKGDEGPRPILKAQKKKKRNRTATHYILGVDQVKTDILMSLPLGNGEQNSIRFSNSLEEDFFLQLTGERRETKIVSGKPVVGFVRIQNRRVEALDCVVYAIAAKQLCQFDYDNRYEQLRGSGKPRRPNFKELAAKLHG